MSKPKSKAGKKPARKTAPRKSAPKARTQAPEAAQPTAPTYPCMAIVRKGGDQIPVTLKDRAHHERLVAEHGDGSVEVPTSEVAK